MRQRFRFEGSWCLLFSLVLVVGAGAAGCDDEEGQVSDAGDVQADPDAVGDAVEEGDAVGDAVEEGDAVGDAVEEEEEQEPEPIVIGAAMSTTGKIPHRSRS